MKARRIELHIDELVLHGFEHSTRYAVGEALERELARLLKSGEINRQSSDQMDAGPVTVHGGAQPRNVGTRVAAAIHRSLRQGGRR